MDVHFPSTFEIHQIAYLTQHGWVPSGESWSKAGFTRTVQKRRSCGCHFEDIETDEYDLDSAYYAQQGASP